MFHMWKLLLLAAFVGHSFAADIDVYKRQRDYWAAVQAAAAGFVTNGFQGPGGSAYVVVNTSTPFTTVTATSNVVSFEFAVSRQLLLPSSSRLRPSQQV